MRIKGKPKYDGVMNIPEGKSGAWSIRHFHKGPGESVPMNTSRTKIYGQPGPLFMSYNKPTRWHGLYEDKGMWMSDFPVEQRQCDDAIRHISEGTVLVGGLGLGYAATALALKKKVKKVIVVEIESHVISLVRPHLLNGREERLKIEVVHEDIMEYLKSSGPDYFDNAFYDIWLSDGEGTFFETVCPLLKLSKGKVRRRPKCWNEDIMRSQLLMSLHQRKMLLDNPQVMPPNTPSFDLDALSTPRDTIWWDWMVPFWKVVKAHPDWSADNFSNAALLYSQGYGDPYISMESLLCLT